MSAFLVLTWTSCGDGVALVESSAPPTAEQELRPPSGGGGGITTTTTTTTTLSTFIIDSIEIDQFSDSLLLPEDANLFVGADPADGTLSVQKPADGPGQFIDWEDLGADRARHQLLDLVGADGKDPTAFVRSNECVGNGSVLSKMDLTYVAGAHNHRYAYVAVQRANNNGDAAYYSLFTVRAPKLLAGHAPCHADESRLLYDISGAPGSSSLRDVMLVGHFHPGSDPLVRVFRAKANVTDLPATLAVDFTNKDLWEEDAASVAAAAVNTTPTQAGAMGAEGVLASTTTASGTTVDADIFAEAATRLGLFSGDDVCGSVFYGSVITRSSGAGGTSPDLKDLAGPAKFDLRVVSPVATLTPGCGSSVTYEAHAAEGQAVTCHWVFDDGQISDDCSGAVTLSPGTHSATVTVTDATTACTGQTTAVSATVGAPLSVEAELFPTCDLSLAYRATVPFADPPLLTYAWTIEGPTAATLSDAGAADGFASFDAPGGTYSARVVVSQLQPDGTTCTAEARASADAFAPIAVETTLTPTCGLDFQYASAVTGGSPSGVTYAWTFSGPGDVNADRTAANGNATSSVPGSYNTELVVTGRRQDVTCSARTSRSINTSAPLAVAAQLVPTCGLGFDYASTVTGGTGAVRYAWTFDGASAVSPSAPESAAGSAAVLAPGGAYRGTVNVVDTRTDIECAASATASVQAFAPLQATANLAPTCGLAFTYASTVTGGSGQVTSQWAFDGATPANASDPSAPSGSVDVQAPGGAYRGTLTVTDARADIACTTTASDDVNAFAPIVATASLSPTCDLAFQYASGFSGGSGEARFEWSFSGATAVSASDAAAANGAASVGSPGGQFAGTVLVTDARSDISCASSASSNVSAFSPLQAVATLSPTCGLAFDYASNVTGGSGVVRREWSFEGATAVHPTDPSSGSGSADVDAPGGAFRGTLLATDVRTDIVCSTSASDDVDAFSPIVASASLSPSCDLAFQYASGFTGGSGEARFDWSFSGATAVSASDAAAANGAASVGAPGGQFAGTVVVTDARGDISCASSATSSVNAFPPLSAVATLSPTCGLAFNYASNVTGGSGLVRHAWTFDGATPVLPSDLAAPAGSANVDAPGGAFHGTLVATDERTDILCNASASGDVNAWPPLALDVIVAGTCSSSLNYSAAVSGGSPAGVSYAWSFTDANEAAFDASTTDAGTVVVGPQATGGGEFTGTVRVSDLRSDIACSREGADSAQVYSPIEVHIRPTTTPAQCADGSADDVVFAVSSLTGGSGDFTYAWSGRPDCVGASSCVVDPTGEPCTEKELSLTVTDAMCPAATSETGTYAKVTVVTAGIR